MVDRISHALMLPSHHLPARRPPSAARFSKASASGKFSKLVTGRVLNEGVDVPDADGGDCGERQLLDARIRAAAGAGAAAQAGAGACSTS